MALRGALASGMRRDVDLRHLHLTSSRAHPNRVGSTTRRPTGRRSNRFGRKGFAPRGSQLVRSTLKFQVTIVRGAAGGFDSGEGFAAADEAGRKRRSKFSLREPRVSAG